MYTHGLLYNVWKGKVQRWKGGLHLFLRYESFREYIRYYPVNTLILALLAAVHIGFFVAEKVYGVPAGFLKQVFGGFIKGGGFEPELWRYVSSIFIHGNFGHLLFNAFAVFVFAPPLERTIGHFRHAVLFLFSGVVGNIFTYLFYSEVLSIGASGAVYGFFGAYVYFMLFHKRAIDVISRKTLTTILVIGLIYSFMPGVNFAAHLGGFLGGLLLNGLYVRVLMQGRGR